jgi:predicted enzyme related to lactoylglutathione lyase
VQTLRAMPILQVSDMLESIAFYKRAGFSGLGWSDPKDGAVFFTIAQRGDVSLGLQLRDEPLRVDSNWAAYIYVDDIDALHAEFIAQGLHPTDINRPDYYGCDDFNLCDPNGHVLCFGQVRNAEHTKTYGPGLSDQRGRG